MTSLTRSASAPAVSTPVGPAADHDEGEGTAVDAGGLEVGVLEELQDPVAELLGVGGGVERQGVLLGPGHPEEGGPGAGGQHQDVAGEGLPARRCATVAPTGSTAVTSASLTATEGCLRNRPRSGRMMSLGASWAVATWYSRGWNWW